MLFLYIQYIHLAKGENMTIKEYLDGLGKLPHRSPDGESLAEIMADVVSIWSNDACMGYCMAAMDSAGISPDEQREVLRAMHRAFDDLTIRQAEEIYLRS